MDLSLSNPFILAGVALIFLLVFSIIFFFRFRRYEKASLQNDFDMQTQFEMPPEWESNASSLVKEKPLRTDKDTAQELENVRNEIGSLTKTLNQLTSTITKTESIRRKILQTAKRKSQQDNFFQQQTESTESNLTAKIEKVQKERDELDKNCQQLQKNIREKYESIEILELEKNQLATELHEFKENINEIQQEIKSLQAENKHLQFKLQKSDSSVSTLIKKIEATKAEKRKLTDTLQQNEEDHVRYINLLKNDISQLRKNIEKLHLDNSLLSEENNVALSSVEALGKAKRDIKNLKVKIQIVQSQANSAETLKEELITLQETLKEKELNSVPLSELKGLEKSHKELLIKSKLSTQRIEELQSYADENTIIKKRMESLSKEAARCEELEETIRELKSQALVTADTTSTQATEEASEDSLVPVVSPKETVGESLNYYLDKLVEKGVCKIAVVSDKQGLLLAAAGDNQYYELLGAVSGIMQNIAIKVTDYLPLYTPRSVELIDMKEVGIRSRLFNWKDEILTVTTMGTLHTDHDAELESLTTILPALLTPQKETIASSSS